MNLIEAIKSGRKFRRKAWVGNTYKFFDGHTNLVSTDIVADDWEVEDITVTITKSQFDAAWKKVVVFDAYSVRDLLAKELGL